MQSHPTTTALESRPLRQPNLAATSWEKRVIKGIGRTLRTRFRERCLKKRQIVVHLRRPSHRWRRTGHKVYGRTPIRKNWSVKIEFWSFSRVTVRKPSADYFDCTATIGFIEYDPKNVGTIRQIDPPGQEITRGSKKDHEIKTKEHFTHQRI